MWLPSTFTVSKASTNKCSINASGCCWKKLFCLKVSVSQKSRILGYFAMPQDWCCLKTVTTTGSSSSLPRSLSTGICWNVSSTITDLLVLSSDEYRRSIRVPKTTSMGSIHYQSATSFAYAVYPHHQEVVAIHSTCQLQQIHENLHGTRKAEHITYEWSE